MTLQHPAAWWTANNPTLAEGQCGIETDTLAMKAGDGVTAWNSLPYEEQREMTTTASGTNAYVADYTFPNISGYYVGEKFRVKFTNANTGPSTININNLGAKNIKKNGGASALDPGDIIAGAMYELTYDGTQFQIVINTAL